QPKHSATSTAPAQSSDATPVCFLAIRTSTSSASAPLASSQASNSPAVAKNSTSTAASLRAPASAVRATPTPPEHNDISSIRSPRAPQGRQDRAAQERALFSHCNKKQLASI